MEIRIAHLYARLLNIYGDRGNIITLQQRSLWRNIAVEIKTIGLGEKIDPDWADIYFIGGGQDKQQIMIAQDLQKHSDSLHKAADAGAVMLAVCGGYQLFGHYYQPHEGPKLPGISLLDAHTVAGDKRMIGNVTIALPDKSSNLLGKSDNLPNSSSNLPGHSTLVGFENHSGKTFLGKGLSPLGKVVKGNGNNGEDGLEGAHYKNIYGTYLHGSLLPKNPYFADQLIAQALVRRYGQIKLAVLNDRLELEAHKSALALKA